MNPAVDQGLDWLIKACRDNDFEPNRGNLYAGLGST